MINKFIFLNLLYLSSNLLFAYANIYKTNSDKNKVIMDANKEFKESNYYDILQVKQDCSQDEIKQAFKKLAKVYHPDLHPNDKNATSNFQKLNEAYNVLNDPVKRNQYDNTLRFKSTYSNNSFFNNTQHNSFYTNFSVDDSKISLFERIFLAYTETKKKYYARKLNVPFFQQWDDFYFKNLNHQYVDDVNFSPLKTAETFYLSFNFDSLNRRSFTIYDANHQLVIGELKFLIIERFKQEEKYNYDIWYKRYGYRLDVSQNDILYQVFQVPRKINNHQFNNNRQDVWTDIFGMGGFEKQESDSFSNFQSTPNNSATTKKSKRRKITVILSGFAIITAAFAAIWRFIRSFIK